MPKPFDDDLELLEAEVEYLRCRATRVVVEERKLAAIHEMDTGGDAQDGGTAIHDHQCRLLLIKDREKALRDEIDARLQVHRQDAARPKLGLDRLTENHRLSPDERMLVVAAAIPAISQTLAEATFHDLGSMYGALSTEDLARLQAPGTVREWVEARRLMDPKAPLVKEGLLVVEQDDTGTPSDLWQTSAVYVSPRVLWLLTGEPEPTVPTNGTMH
jgi:hypothetical protein